MWWALVGPAIYLLTELHKFLEEEIFSGSLPTILEVIYGALAMIILFGSMRFTVVKSYAEIMEIGMQKKTRKKRESEIEDS